MKHMKQLDAIRALGVFGVFHQHFVACKVAPITIFGHRLYYGATSLDSFYVLSGFLITGILLKNKVQIDTGSETILSCIKTFFVRRSLRIFPIFYVALAVGFIFGIAPVRESIWWHLSYLSNVWLAKSGTWNNAAVTHLWSLAVEEQFYFLWPWIILLIPGKKLPVALIAIIAVAPVFRYVCGIMQTNDITPFVITFGNLDLLGLGSLLAYFKNYSQIYGERSQDRLKWFLRFCLVVGGSMFVLTCTLMTLELNRFMGIFTRTFEGLFICWFINRAADGFGGILGYVLELKPLLYLGKISYGLYLYHLFVQFVTIDVLGHLHIPVTSSAWGQFFLYSTLSVITASVSWHMIEKPICMFKDRLQARGKTEQYHPAVLAGR